MLVYGYTDYDGVLHIFATYEEAVSEWAADGNAGVTASPSTDGMRIEDHRSMPMPVLGSTAPAPGSFAHFQSLGQ